MKLNVLKKLTKRNMTINHEGAPAYKASPQLDLYLRACSCLIEDRYYSKANEQLDELRKAVHACSRSFVLKLARYARQEMKLRTLPMILLAEASTMHSGNPAESKSDVRTYAAQIIQRADEPAEVLAYWIQHLGKGQKSKLPNALKKGLSDSLRRFDEYQLAKYNRSGDVKLKDVLQLVHAKPDTAERSAMYKRVLEDNLATPDTWEVRISSQGSQKESWEAAARKMGIMALVRNLRNFEKHDAQDAMLHAIEVLTDAKRVQASRILPFRWLAAEREVSSSLLRDALREALELSLANVPVWEGRTAIFVDLSGSMHSALSGRSKMLYIDVAALMGAMATRLSGKDFLVGGFGHNYKDIRVSAKDSVLSNAERIRHTDVGHSTNAYKAIESIRKRGKVFDRVLIFSDMQCYDTRDRQIYADGSLAQEWQRYRSQINGKALLYSIDLAGYGSLQFPEQQHGVFELGGWSERVLDLITALEKGQSAVDLIEAQY